MPPLPPNPGADVRPRREWISQKTTIIAFSCIAIALYGYDQGMMSMVNTNHSYLRTMGIAEDSSMVGVIVSVYYLGCLFGAIIASSWADRRGRKSAIRGCLLTTVLGNILMFIPGLYPTRNDHYWGGSSCALMLAGRVVLGLGVGGIDATIPVYSAELAKDSARGVALAKEFQANILGLLLAFGFNLGFTRWLGKDSEWAWRVPIMMMQLFPWLLFLLIRRLPESPRWLVSEERMDDAHKALAGLHGEVQADEFLDHFRRAQEREAHEKIGYLDMIKWNGSQFHPTMVTIMCQINQALTGFGAVSVYGPQIFQLLGWDAAWAENMTIINYTIYFLMMTLAWLTIDKFGRRPLMVYGSAGLAFCFAILALLGGLALDFFKGPELVIQTLGSVFLVMSTAVFGICWLTTVWLIPTEIFPSTVRAQGSAISVITWGLTNFAVTLLTPMGFTYVKYWLFIAFATTNAFAGFWTWRYSPETGGRSFEQNQAFFVSAREQGSWVVKHVDGGRFLRMPTGEEAEESSVEESSEEVKDDSSSESANPVRVGRLGLHRLYRR